MRRAFERPAGQRGRIGIAQRHGGGHPALLPVDVARLLQQAEELDRHCRPARYVAGQLLENDPGALGLPIGQRIGDIGPEAALAELAQRPGPDQVADIGHGPVLAGLDEPVVVELIGVALDQLELPRQDLHQRQQRAPLVGVAGGDVARQQLVQPVDRTVTHRQSPASGRCRWEWRPAVRRDRSSGPRHRLPVRRPPTSPRSASPAPLRLCRSG